MDRTGVGRGGGTGTTLRRTPLYEEHLALGGRMVPFAGWEMPARYTELMEEHAAVRAAAGAFDVSHMGEFRVSGPGASAFLQSSLCNDVSRIGEVGAAQYTLLCDDGGGIVDDLVVYHTGDSEYLIVANASNTAIDRHILASMAGEDVEFADESDRTALIALQGPLAMSVLRELADERAWLPPPRFHIAEGSVAGTPVLVSRTGYTGEDGAELFCAAAQAVSVWRGLMSMAEVTPCGLGARDTLRLEMGYPLYGAELGRDADPISAGLGRFVALGKGGFVGRDAIARISESGPERRLVGMRVADAVPRAGHTVLRDGEEVGKVASGTFSPTLSTGIATAYVPSDLAEPGTELRIAVRGRFVRAVVEKPPFVEGTSLDAVG